MKELLIVRNTQWGTFELESAMGKNSIWEALGQKSFSAPN